MNEPRTITLPEVQIPILPAFDNENAMKLEGVAKALGIPLDQSFKTMHDAASQAILAAETIREHIAALNRGEIIQNVVTPPHVVKMDWHDRMATDVKLGRTIAVRGPAGNGKSIGVRSVLESMGYNVYSMDCTDSTTAEMLIGGLYPVVENGAMKMEYRDGIFGKAFADEKGAILLDEFDALDPRVGMVLQSALHRAMHNTKRVMSCPDHPEGRVEAKGDCPVVVTMNTWGGGATREYVGRNAIDAASMDRFDTVLDTNYMHEEAILANAGYKTQICKDVVAHAVVVRNNIAKKNLRVVLSTRRLLNVAETVDKLGVNVKDAFKRDFFDRLDPMDKEALA